MEVRPIKAWETHEWLLNKHYAKRIPPISFAFGLYMSKQLRGVCTFGPPCRAYNNGEHIFNSLNVLTLELNRLVIDINMPSNTLSWFVSNAVKQLPRPCCVVSYADDGQGHHGYIYQATNWIYTGLNEVHDTEYIINGKITHTRTLQSQGISAPKKWAEENNIETTGKSSKHRYFKFVGSKIQKKNMLKKLKLPILPYPKGDNKRYDDSYEIERQQGILF